MRPDCQGQGLGGRLLAPVLARADNDGKPCYLETQPEEDAAVYARRGLPVVDRQDILGLSMWFMIREPSGLRSPA